MPSLYRLTCGAFDATPKNVRLQNGLAPIVTKFLPTRNVFLINAPEILPTPNQVAAGVSYGENGVEFVGTLSGGTGYPAEGDVEAGVVYGAASEYTGDFHVPAQTDVKTGVGYGNAGTEFTGSYGGGSAGYSRGRVVNE